MPCLDLRPEQAGGKSGTGLALGHLGLLAETYLHNGEVEAGLSAVSEALEIGARERLLFFEAELLRLRALLLLARDPDDATAEEQLESALAVARRQASPSLELRAALSLARVRMQRGRAGPQLDRTCPGALPGGTGYTGPS